MNNQPFFSIVIPTLNEERYLPNLLQDLGEQSFDLKKVEIIHVDGDSEDGTVKNTQKFKKKLNLKTIKTKKQNVSWQRNLGAEKAKGEWVIFMDADNRLPNYFLDGIKYQLAKNQSTDIFTCWISPDGSSPTDIAIAKSLNLAMELYSQIINRHMTFGALIGVKKEITKIIKFDEKQKIVEDSYFTREVIDQGFHFQLFRQPTYTFSLRRLRKEGTLKMARSVSLMNLKFLQGKDFLNNDHGYVMKGGKYYEEKSASTIESLAVFLQKASQHQLDFAKKVLRKINEELEG